VSLAARNRAIRPPLVPRVRRNHREQFHVAPSQVGFVNVGETAEPKDLNIAFVEKPLALLPGEVINVGSFDSEPGLNIGGNVLAERFAVFRHT